MTSQGRGHKKSRVESKGGRIKGGKGGKGGRSSSIRKFSSESFDINNTAPFEEYRVIQHKINPSIDNTVLRLERLYIGSNKDATTCLLDRQLMQSFESLLSCVRSRSELCTVGKTERVFILISCKLSKSDLFLNYKSLMPQNTKCHNAMGRFCDFAILLGFRNAAR